MSTFKEKIEQEIADHKAQIAALESHLAAAGSWLEVEVGNLWVHFKDLFNRVHASGPPAPPAPPAPEAPKPDQPVA